MNTVRVRVSELYNFRFFRKSPPTKWPLESNWYKLMLDNVELFLLKHVNFLLCELQLLASLPFQLCVDVLLKMRQLFFCHSTARDQSGSFTLQLLLRIK